MRMVKADAALVSRTFNLERKVKYIARCSIHEGKVWASQPQTQSELVLGDCISSARPGSIWKLSDVRAADGVPTPSCRDRNPNALREVIVVPLELTGGHVDHLEFHFGHSPAFHDLDLLAILASTMASGWSKRVPGSISANLEKGRKHLVREVRSDDHIATLDPQNPAGLSRCEFRVCAMMKEGMTVKKISQALTVSPTTVRSHLSSIFSKTGASNQVELLHLLNQKTKARHKSNRSEIPRAS